MPELAALIESVNQLNASNEDLVGEVVDLRAEIGNLPDKYLPRDEAEVKAERAKKAIAIMALAGLLVASVVGFVLYLNHGTTCGVRGILISAQTSSTRNPLPENMSPELRDLVIRQREQARTFYSESLDHLNIVWPCSGESAP